MEWLSSAMAFLGSLNLMEWVMAVQGLLAGALVLALMIPGDQPDKFLTSAVEFLKKFSKK